ncbi:hypothetical protein CDD81_6541 [Ophiocordyceps australis]|uniref:NADP-dependent oxidoreductase domain-containing protein n=1 Tax=Ophiocordyceps australis TaxID=1399860 RepID=A0A2C5YI93_9HYPO|nr:hypothetical protein CDD81_6541 [Ophiocordyceps australis]
MAQRVGQTSRLARDIIVGGPNSAAKMPRLIYGTAWKKERTADFVYAALQAGFRAIDTAAQPRHYNEPGVGQGVRRAVEDGLVKRQDIFIQTKFTALGGQSSITPYDRNAPLAEQVRQSVESSLANFTMADGEEPYLDSLVLHSPMDTLQDTMMVWKTLETYTPHRVRHLGISNTSVSVLQTLCDNMATKPVIVQNRFYARTRFESQVRSFCAQRGIIFQAFWTISANAPLVQSEPVEQIARSANVQLPEAYYSLILGLGDISVLDGTTDEEHMKQDLEGIEKVGLWAEGEGGAEWATALKAFKAIIKDAEQVSQHGNA